LIDFFGSKMRQNNELKRFGISTKNRNALVAKKMPHNAFERNIENRGGGIRP